MKLNPVKDSKAVTGESYDAASQTLTLRFKNGFYYNYANVDPQKYAQFQAAESQGNWVTSNLTGENAKKNHPFNKIPPPAEEQQ